MQTGQPITKENRLEKIPSAFQILAKEILKKELHKHNPILNPDKIHINIAHEEKISSETLLEALLKKSIDEERLLVHPLAGLYSNSESVNAVDQIHGLTVKDTESIIERLTPILISTYYHQIDSFGNSGKISIPQEVLFDPTSDFLKTLVENFSLIERTYQVDSMYPNLKQTVTSYLSQKLKNLHSKDIHPDTVNVLLFKKGEESSFAFLRFTLTNFVLNYFSAWSFYSHYLSEQNIIQIKLSQDAQDIALSKIFQASDATAIKSKHEARLESFWRKNTNNYRILAKFSYLKTLLEQQNSTFKLSSAGLELALKAMGFDQESIKKLIKGTDEIALEEIPLTILETLSNPKQVEVSSFLINEQISSDILKICDPETKELLIYIPGYTPSFVEAKNENLLVHWIFHQAEVPSNLSSIASHFPHFSRMADPIKLDAFLYSDYIKQKEGPLVAPCVKDIFSFTMEKQKERIVADLHVHEIPVPIQYTYFPVYRSTERAFFTTIAAAFEQIPYLLPNIHTVSSDLHELFPYPQQTAAEYIKKEIKNRFNLDLDPNQTFIGYFIPEKIPPSSDESPSYKMLPRTQSLTEATLSNYRMGFTVWSSSTIVFTDSSGIGKEYPLRNQLVNILPKDVEEIIQEVDLETLHKEKLNTFWNNHIDRIKFFIKHRYLQQALEEYQNKVLSEESFKVISEIAFYSLHLEEEGLPALINPNIRIESVYVASYQSTDLFIFRNTSKEQVILYLAGNAKPFFTFINYEECICFLEENAKKDIKWRSLLTAHFSIDVQDSVLSNLKQGPYKRAKTIGFPPYPQPSDCSFTEHVHHIITTKPIEKSLFETIQKNIQERSYLDASAVITSDKELMLKRVALVLDSLGRALLVPSFAFPILNWTTLALLATESTLNLYIAKNGDTAKERYQAAKEIGTTALELLLLGAFLSFRSLKFARNKNPYEPISDETHVHIASGGRGVQTFLKKIPLSEENFFGTTKPMQVWNIAASNSRFSYLDVKGWFLGEKFLLFTGKTNKAKHLVISSHGGYFPGSGIVKVPANVELVVLGPHGWELVDAKISSIAKKSILPYGIINENTALPTPSAFLHLPIFSNPPPDLKPIDIKILAGTTTPGHIKNYSLFKYQKFGANEESYLDIVQLVNRSRNTLPIIHEMGLDPVDVLTIRNRVGMLSPNLEDLFKSLQNHEIHYDRITLLFCRSNALLSGAHLAPRYIPPMITSV